MKYLFLLMFIVVSLQAQNSLEEAIDSYYSSLNEQAEKASSNNILKNAYESFARIPTLDDFLLYNTAFNGTDATTIREQNKSRRGFFYPAALYNNYETLLLSFNELKMVQLQQEIKNMENKLDKIVADQTIQKKALKALEGTFQKLKEENTAIEKEIKDSRKLVESLEENIAEAERRINLIRSDIRRVLDEELQTIAIIRRLDAEIIRELDEVKKIALISRRNVLERQRRGLQASATDLQAELERLSLAIVKADADLQKFSRNLPDLERKQQKILPELEEIAEEREKIIRKIEEYDEQLKPLAILQKQQEKIADVVEEYQNWWQQANQKPKHHFLLALYVLDKYPKENYNVVVKEWYGLEGIVEVYFW